MVAATSNLIITDRYGKAKTSPKTLSLRWVLSLLFHAIIGLIVLFINSPKLVALLVEENIKNEVLRDCILIPLNSIQEALLYIIGSEPISFFERAITCSFLLVFIWLIMSLFVSIRHKQPQWFLLAGMGLSLGFFVLHLLAWLAALFVAFFGISLVAFGWIKKAFGFILNFTFDYRVIFLSIIVILTVYLIRKSIPALWRWFTTFLKKYWLKVTASIAAIGIAFLVIPILWTKIILPLWNSILSPALSWLMWLFATILGFVIFILLFIVFIAAIPFVLALLGALLLSQLHAGWQAGRDTKYTLIAGFAIGSLLTLILLISNSNPDLLSSINSAWAKIFFNWEVLRSQVIPIDALNFYLPEPVESFSDRFLVGTQAPVVDTAILMLILTMAIVSLTERLFSSEKCAPSSIKVEFVLVEYLKIILGMFLALVLIFIVGFAEGD